MAASAVSAGSSSPKGCYSSTTGLTLATSQTFNSIGSCSQLCLGKKAEAMAMQDSDCYCGSTLPPLSLSIDDGKCSIPCPGYPDDLCEYMFPRLENYFVNSLGGGVGAYSVYSTGLSAAVSNLDPSSTSATASPPESPKAPATSIVTVGTAPTVIVTAKPDLNDDKSGGESTNKAGIAAGVVVGLLVFAAIAGGAVIFLRHKKRRAIEEEHRQAAAVNSFIEGGKFNGPVADTLLDPGLMANRRMSDGSIADNQDYSRRILKVHFNAE